VPACLPSCHRGASGPRIPIPLQSADGGASTLKIEFSKAEYRTLIEMLYLAQWVLTCHDEQPEPSKERHFLLCQKIYASAKAMGCETLIENDKQLRAFVPSEKLEALESVRDAIETYNAESFWEELIDRLLERDVTALLPTLTREPSNPEEYWELAGPIEERYATEFATNGVRRLKISDS
jgi:hypothetical protein